MNIRICVLSVLVAVCVMSCGSGNGEKAASGSVKTITVDEMRDKIAGGWAGKMIGVAYGAPTEFRALGETYEKDIVWEPSLVKGSLRQDDILSLIHI